MSLKKGIALRDDVISQIYVRSAFDTCTHAYTHTNRLTLLFQYVRECCDGSAHLRQRYKSRHTYTPEGPLQTHRHTYSFHLSRLWIYLVT